MAKVKIKITSLAITKILVGMATPKQDNGNVGNFVQDVMEQHGYDMNRGRGCDSRIGYTPFEIKTRKVESISPHTVCTTGYEEICNTPYEQSNLKAKFQVQYRVYYKDGDPGIIIKAKVCHFTDDCIQSQIKLSYETARTILASNPDYYNNCDPWTTVRGFENCPGYFEKTKDGTSWKFRITDSAMTHFESIDANRDMAASIFN